MGRLMILGMFGMLLSAFAAGGDDEQYIRVDIKGTLRTGMMAIGGETTGTVIRIGDVTWELDFGDNKDLRELATKLNNKKVLVTGTYHKKMGVEIKERHIVRVASLKPG